MIFVFVCVDESEASQQHKRRDKLKPPEFPGRDTCEQRGGHLVERGYVEDRQRSEHRVEDLRAEWHGCMHEPGKCTRERQRERERETRERERRRQRERDGERDGERERDRMI